MTEIRYRDKVLSLADASYVLGDVREAFGLPTAVLRFAGTEIVAVAMAHEPITRLDVCYDLHVPEEHDASASGRSANDDAAALQQLVALGGQTLLSVLAAGSATGGDDYRPEPCVASSRTVYPPAAYSPFRSGPQGLKREQRWAQSPPYVAPVEAYVLPAPDAAAVPRWVVPQTVAAAASLMADLKALSGALDARTALSAADTAASSGPLDVKPQLN
jgi:hypothetical protein